MEESLEGLIPESWLCVDCGVNTAPGCLNRIEMEKAIEALGRDGKRGEAFEFQSTISRRSTLFAPLCGRQREWSQWAGAFALVVLKSVLGVSCDPRIFYVATRSTRPMYQAPRVS
jgi:hypothetical protein